MAQKGAWLLHIIGNEAPPAESNSVRAVDFFQARVISIANRAMLTAYVSCMYVRVRLRTLGQSERRVPPAPIRTPERSARLGG